MPFKLGSPSWNAGLKGAQVAHNLQNPYPKSDPRNEGYRKYRHHRSRCVDEKNPKFDKLGNRVHFLISFEDWWDIWQKSGYYDLMGRGIGKYCMSRINDVGNYEITNVFIQSQSANTKEALVKNPRNLCKRCTIDGIKIYDSHKSMVAELGRGKSGPKHPNFRYI
jgi:hypothetical protein